MNKNYIIIFLVLCVFAILYFGWRSYSSKLRSIAESNVVALNDTIKHYQIEIDKQKLEVFEKNALILSQKDAIQAGLLDRDALRKINIEQASELTKIKALISVVRDSVSHTGIVIKDTAWITPKYSILLPFSFSDSTKFINLKGYFNQSGKLIYSLKVPVNLDVYTGYKDKVLKTSIVTDNPYISIQDITTIKMDSPKIKKFGIGIFTGYGISSGGLSPVIGVGINYNIFTF